MERDNGPRNHPEGTESASSTKRIKDLGPLMTRKFMEAEQANYTFPPPQIRAFSKEFHFLYGTLMDTQTLAKV
ncbi:hypothetical protein V494_05926 [Pseudogymnoascus sp. VKM F-4513 (FW-928)]|nr:hypothetical protein V494_05926 [Pseudogymnoascus sp. VKM F-4513 (FW-928)]